MGIKAVPLHSMGPRITLMEGFLWCDSRSPGLIITDGLLLGCPSICMSGLSSWRCDLCQTQLEVASSGYGKSHLTKA